MLASLLRQPLLISNRALAGGGVGYSQNWDILRPSVLYVDATDLLAFGSADNFGHQAEITLIVSGGKEGLPDLPLVFTDDFLDVDGPSAAPRTTSADRPVPRIRRKAGPIREGIFRRLVPVPCPPRHIHLQWGEGDRCISVHRHWVLCALSQLD